MRSTTEPSCCCWDGSAEKGGGDESRALRDKNVQVKRVTQMKSMNYAPGSRRCCRPCIGISPSSLPGLGSRRRHHLGWDPTATGARRILGWMQPAGVGRGDGVEAGVGRGDGVEAVDAAERATAGAACSMQPGGRRPGRRVGGGRRPGLMGRRRASGVGRGSTVSGWMRQTQGRRVGFRARGLEWP